MDGYLNFYATVPSHLKNTLLCRKRYFNPSEQVCGEDNKPLPNQSSVYFPIRGMDFNAEDGILYTGDEAGYLQKWDLNPLLTKLNTNEEVHKAR